MVSTDRAIAIAYGLKPTRRWAPPVGARASAGQHGSADPNSQGARNSMPTRNAFGAGQWSFVLCVDVLAMITMVTVLQTLIATSVHLDRVFPTSDS